MSTFQAGEVIEQVNKVMNEGFEIPLEKLQPEAKLFEDLELDSLDAIDMLVYLEEKLDLKVDSEQFKEVRTLNDVYQMVEKVSKESKPQP